MWSISRPGVATRMSTPRRSASICGPMPTPPKIVVALHAQVLAVGADAVVHLRGEFAGRGQDQRARALARCAGAALRANRRCSSGSANAAVLPVPVCAPAEQVVAGERDRNRGGLDRGGVV